MSEVHAQQIPLTDDSSFSRESGQDEEEQQQQDQQEMNSTKFELLKLRNHETPEESAGEVHADPNPPRNELGGGVANNMKGRWLKYFVPIVAVLALILIVIIVIAVIVGTKYANILMPTAAQKPMSSLTRSSQDGAASTTPSTPRHGQNAQNSDRANKDGTMPPTAEAALEVPSLVKLVLNMSAVATCEPRTPPCPTRKEGAQQLCRDSGRQWLAMRMAYPPHNLSPFQCEVASTSRGTDDCQRVLGSVYRLNGSAIDILQAGIYDISTQITARCACKESSNDVVTISLTVNGVVEVKKQQACPQQPKQEFAFGISIALKLNRLDQLAITLEHRESESPFTLEICAPHSTTYLQLAMRLNAF